MVAIQIRDVSPEVRDALARDAADRGLSMQAYLHDVLERQAKAARNRVWLRDFQPIKVTGGAPVVVDVADLIRRQRVERERHLLAVATGEDT